MEDFWIVWNVRGRAPTKMHKTLEAAEAEASRLAASNTDEAFVVLEAKHAFRCAARPVEKVSIRDLKNDDGIPF